MEHLGFSELITALLGLLVFWVLRWSSDKDESDVLKQPFKTSKWINDWFKYKYDNIIAHFLVSFFFLYMGVDTLEAWIGDMLTLPEGVNEIGTAGFIGFSGSYIAEFLKKGIRLLK